MTEKQLILSPFDAQQYEQAYRVVRRSVDARQRQLKVLLTILYDDEGQPIQRDAPIPLYEQPHFCDVHSHHKGEVAIIGMGPAGLFAALTLLQYGYKPIIFERGKAVSERKVDIAQLNRNRGINTESNYCFGEGGAGTFSDGKLFSRSKKRGSMQRVMELFHYFGANDTILYETHAHIGSDLLPRVITNMRKCIIDHGGEIHFSTCMDESLWRELSAKSIPTILSIGHSAHDTYRLLHNNNVALAAKGTAMGVRVEHPQPLIDRLLYHLQKTSDKEVQTLVSQVGHAAYSLVTQVDGRGVYSFCMCPGGHILPAGSANNGCVVNGMSTSQRNSPFANSGMVVALHEKDFDFYGKDNPLKGMLYQEHLEQLAFSHGIAPSVAPAQRLADFVNNKKSVSLPDCSYLPGLVSSPLDQWLPSLISRSLKQGFIDFDRKFNGFITNEAVIVGVESRSSSPVRIVRDIDSMQSLSHSWLYPCGEGGGYAGGITSSALDGINAAKALVSRF